jgi:hypothetical protein
MSPARQALMIVLSGTVASVTGRFGALELLLLLLLLLLPLLLPLPLLLLLDVGASVLCCRSAALNSASISSKSSAERTFFLLRFGMAITGSAGKEGCIE